MAGVDVRLDGPDGYWSQTDPPSRGQRATIAALALELLEIDQPKSRLDATVTLARLAAACEQKKAGQKPAIMPW